MAIRIGNSKRSYLHGALLPSNTGSGHLAKNLISNLVSSQNRRHQEALLAGGFFCHVWIRSQRGYPCTCCSNTNKINQTYNGFSDNNLLPNDRINNLPQNDGLSLNSGETDNSLSFTIRRVRGEYHKITTDKLENLLSINPSSKIGTDFDLIPPDVAYDTDKTQNLGEEDLSPLSNEEIALLTQGNTFSLFGGDKTKCSICFGTGYTEGYQLYNGQRFILDLSGRYPYTNSGFDVDNTQQPFQFKTDCVPTNSIIWTLQLPTYFKKALRIQVYNNLQPIDSLFTIQYQIVGTNNWTILNIASLNVLIGQTNNIRIKVSPNNSSPSDIDFKFTHVEIILQYADFAKADMPQLNLPQSFEYFQPQITSQMELSAEIDGLDRECVIGDSRHNQIWKVISSETMKTNENQIFNNSLEVRLIQKQENLNLLNLLVPVVQSYNFTRIMAQQGIEI